MDDDEIKAKLQAMWTPEMWDRFKADMRARLEASPQYKDRPEERDAMLENVMQRARETFQEWPPKAKMTSPMLMVREEVIDDNEFKAALRAHVLHRISEERIESKVGMGGMTREQVIDCLLGNYANGDLGQRLKAYHSEHGHYPEPLGFFPRYTQRRHWRTEGQSVGDGRNDVRGAWDVQSSSHARVPSGS